MSLELHSLRTMRSPLLLEGPHQRRRYRRDPWPFIAVLVVLVLAGLAVVRQRRAHGSACPSGHCERVGR